MVRALLVASVATIIVPVPLLAEKSSPKPIGKMVDLGGHRLHMNCSGAGSPVVIVENGLGDFSFDWILVQEKVARFARICTMLSCACDNSSAETAPSCRRLERR